MRIAPNTPGLLNTAALREARARLVEAGTLPSHRPSCGVDDPGGAGGFHSAYVNVNARTHNPTTTKKGKVK